MRKRLLSILLLCALLTGSAAAVQLPAEDAASPAVLSAGEQITGAGIDVRQFQGVIDWDTTAQYIDVAIIRCGRGSDLTAAAAAVDAKLPELVTALTGGLLGSDAAEQNAAQIRQWVAPAHEG